MSNIYVSRWSCFLGRYVTDFSRSKRVLYYGAVALCCGAPSAQKTLAANQTGFFTTQVSNAKAIFGNSSSVFNDLIDTYAPTVAAGPNQEGFNQAEKTALNTEVTEGTGAAYEHAAKALGEKQAAAGGGNVYIPKGQDEQMQEEVATKAAQQESNQRLGITQEDYAVGRENYNNATRGLAAAPGVFTPSTQAAGEATGAGNAAENTEAQIASEDNSWVNAVVGGVAGLGGAVLSGGMSNLGKGKSFFGNG